VNNKKLELFLVIVTLICCTLLLQIGIIIFEPSPIEVRGDLNHINYELKYSKSWDLTPIFIDDSNPNYNWDKTATDNEWCSGNGTWSNPYIIENVTINGQTVGNCIEIRNSDVHFILHNCTIYNSGSLACIYMNSVSNGHIFKNEISTYADVYVYEGIFLDLCHNLTIRENNVRGSIVISESLNNSIIQNTIIDDDLISGGIILEMHSENNTVQGNLIVNSYYHGVYGGITVVFVSNNTIIDNLLINSTISIDGPTEMIKSNFIDQSNLVNGKPFYLFIGESELNSQDFINAGQVILYQCSDSMIVNLIGTKIHLMQCFNITIQNNTLTYSNHGIQVEDSSYINIKQNEVNYSFFYGMWIINSSFNYISQNNISHSKYSGIFLLNYCNNNTIIENIAEHSILSGGIFLSHESLENVITLNKVSNNHGYGIWLFRSHYNTITYNTANSNSNGIFIDDSDFNIISRNAAHFNYRGIFLSYSDNNQITHNNLIGNLYCIEEHFCSGNIFISNICKESEKIPGFALIWLITSIIGVLIFISIKMKKEFNYD